MTLFTIPLRYTRVKWLRTCLLTAVFTLGVASMVGLVQVSALVGESFEQKLVSYGANILVTPKRNTLAVSYGGYTLADITLEEHWLNLPEVHAGIDAMPLRANVSVVAPKLITAAQVNGKQAAIVGVDWREELALKGFWEADGEFPSGSRDLLAGSTLAAILGIQPGQSLRIGDHDFRVSGVLQPMGSDDDAVLFAPIAFVQELTGKSDQAAFLEIAALCSGCPIEDIVAQLQAALPGTDVRAMRQVAESRMYAVHFAQNLAFSVSIVILVTACAMIVMSMLSAVAERRREIGIMRAVGFARPSVFLVFLTEALAVGSLSGALGFALGHWLADHVLDKLHLDAVAMTGFSIGSLLATIAVTAIVSGLAAAFPAWKASLVEPADALVSL